MGRLCHRHRERSRALPGHRLTRKTAPPSGPDDIQDSRRCPTPPPDAVIVAPATYNTINKWAAGIADNYVLTQLAELTGLGVRIVALPFVNQALARNRAFTQSIETLRHEGVRVLFGPGEFEPHPPRTGDTALKTYPWKLAIESARG